MFDSRVFNKIFSNIAENKHDVVEGPEAVDVDPSSSTTTLNGPKPWDVYKCEFKSNKDEKCVFHNENEKEFQEEKKTCPTRFTYQRGYISGGCNLQVESKADITGEWEIISHYKEKEEDKSALKKFTLYLAKV